MCAGAIEFWDRIFGPFINYDGVTDTYDFHDCQRKENGRTYIRRTHGILVFVMFKF
jgi:hypothetical protein